MPHRSFHVRAPVDLRQTLGPFRHMGADPSIKLTRHEAWKATRTPDGPATLRMLARDTCVRADAWGPGAEWMLEHADGLVGSQDDPASFHPENPFLARLHRARPGLRIPRSKRVMELIVPTIIGQKVTTGEAARSWARLCRIYGEPAPGPPGLSLQPDAQVLAELPYYEYHRHGIERRRAETIKRVCREARRLEVTEDMEPSDARLRLQSIDGVGPWTAACVTMAALGDADAVIVGDYHIPHMVTWVLAGEPRGDDVRMLELLRPYKGQRGRVIRLLKTTGISEPAFGPRKRLRAIERI